MEPWAQKHQPKSVGEIQGQNQAVTLLLNYIKNFTPASSDGKRKGRAALIYGKPGCGKTSAIHAIAREMGVEIVEVNASDVRNKDSINAKLGPAMTQMSLFMTGKIILIDEVDGVSGNADRGGLQELASLIDKTRYPVIMTANDPWDKKFATLRNKSLMIEFRSLAYPSILAILKKIAVAEGVDFEEDALTMLARRVGGDLRGAINDFQTLSEYTKRLKKEDLDDLSQRRQKETMIDALMRIFKTKSLDVSLPALDNVDEDIDSVFLWIDENLPNEYKKIDDLMRAYDTLSLADVFRGRIRRRQHWRYLAYINNFLTAGISLAKKEKYQGFNKYTRTTRILKMWQYNQKNAKKKAIAQKIAQKTHTSEKRVMKDTLPYIKGLLAGELSEYFDLNDDEIKYVKSMK